MSFEPNYDSYSHSELVDVYKHINKDAQPKRFNRLCKIMVNKGLLTEVKQSVFELSESAYEDVDEAVEAETQVTPSYTQQAPEPKYDDDGNYIPNEIPIKNRITNALFSFAIVAYGSYGLYMDELWVPISKRDGIALSGMSAVLVFIAIICATAVMAAEIVDHYDKRDNEHTYYKVALWFKYVGYGLFAIAVLLGFLTGAETS